MGMVSLTTPPSFETCMTHFPMLTLVTHTHTHPLWQEKNKHLDLVGALHLDMTSYLSLIVLHGVGFVDHVCGDSTHGHESPTSVLIFVEHLESSNIGQVTPIHG
jgi:hypothetical protein